VAARNRQFYPDLPQFCVAISSISKTNFPFRRASRPCMEAKARTRFCYKKEGKYMFYELRKPLTLTATALFAGMAMTSPVWADACDDCLSMVTEAAASTELTEEQKSVIEAATTEAMKKQATGDTEACVASLADAK